MKRRLWWVLAAAVVCAIVAPLYFWEPRKPTDEKGLQGTWASEKGVRVTFSGNLAVFDHGHGEPKEMFFRLDQRSRPKRIIIWEVPTSVEWPRRLLDTVIGRRKPGLEELHLGLYELDGNRLRLITLQPRPGQDFPESFDSPPYAWVRDFRRE